LQKILVIMKRIFIVASALLVCSLSLHAQKPGAPSISTSREMIPSERYTNGNPKPKTLFRSNIQSSGYGALSTQYSKFNHKDAIFVGAYGGWMINHRLMLGGGGYGLVTRHAGFGINSETNNQNRLRMGYGGLMAEYTFAGNQLFHVAANILVGAGGVTNGYPTNKPGKNEEWQNVNCSAFFVTQPGVNIETNVTKWFRIAAGGSYRLIAGNKLEGISNADMSALAANLSFKFGGF
jgi:hypothetical protein